MKKFKIIRIVAIILGVVVFLQLLRSFRPIRLYNLLLPSLNLFYNQILPILPLILILLAVLVLLFNKSNMISGIIVFCSSLITFLINIIHYKNGVVILMAPFRFFLIYGPLILLLFVGYKMMVPIKRKGILILGSMGIIGILATIIFYSINTFAKGISYSEYGDMRPLPYVVFGLIFLIIILIGVFRIFKETKAEELRDASNSV